MIDKNDYEIINRFDSNNPAEREKILTHATEKIECIKTLLTILSKISKESTLQYTVMLIDEFLQENKSRAELFHQFGKKYQENIYQTFVGMLYLQDSYIVNQVSRILTKLACWSNSFMPEKELRDYIFWIKEQLDERVSI
jgi:V-type H+-transporting ATPase subunit H